MISPETTSPDLAETLALLEGIGAICTPDPDGKRLHVKAPRGAMTAELQERIRQCKPALLAHFASQTSECCCQCDAPVEYYNSRGQPFCQAHRYQAGQQHCAATPGLVRITQSSFFTQDV